MLHTAYYIMDVIYSVLHNACNDVAYFILHNACYTLHSTYCMLYLYTTYHIFIACCMGCLVQRNGREFQIVRKKEWALLSKMTENFGTYNGSIFWYSYDFEQS